MKRKSFLCCLIVTILSFSTSYAYDSEGHKAIEVAAYKLMEKHPAAGNIPDGLTIIQYLKDNGFLNADYPQPHNHFPDLSLERQFAQNRQMYHFMASNRDVLAALNVTGEQAQQQKVLFRALQPCLEMIYFFFREIIKNHHGASQSGRGIYVLMHIIADSYSAEYASRDIITGNLITVKGWRLSRLAWPADAKQAEKGKETLRLLHNSFKTPGDHEWGDTINLSPMAKKAAESIRDMLITLYMAVQPGGDADKVVSNFIEQHFRPLGSKMNGANFVFPGTTVSIPSSYYNQYEKRPKNTTFKYDRFPQHAWMLSLQPALSNHPFMMAYGIEYSKFITPHAADDKGAFVKRIPVGFGTSLSAIAGMPDLNHFTATLRATGFVSCSFALPLVSANLEPYAGVGMYPFSKTVYTSFAGGADLVWNIGSDWFLPWSKANRSTRLSLGYAFDRWSPLTKHSFKLKFGFNTWHGRVSFSHTNR